MWQDDWDVCMKQIHVSKTFGQVTDSKYPCLLLLKALLMHYMMRGLTIHSCLHTPWQTWTILYKYAISYTAQSFIRSVCRLLRLCHRLYKTGLCAGWIRVNILNQWQAYPTRIWETTVSDSGLCLCQGKQREPEEHRMLNSFSYKIKAEQI